MAVEKIYVPKQHVRAGGGVPGYRDPQRRLVVVDRGGHQEPADAPETPKGKAK